MQVTFNSICKTCSAMGKQGGNACAVLQHAFAVWRQMGKKQRGTAQGLVWAFSVGG